MGAFFQSGCGVSAAWIQDACGPPSVQIWALGMDLLSDTPPDFVLEGSFLHALLLAERTIEECRVAPDYVIIQAGTWTLHRRLRQWLELGTLTLSSDAAAEIIKVWHRLHHEARCPLILKPLPLEFFQKEDDNPYTRATTAAELLVEAVARFYRYAIPMAKRR